MKKILAIPNTFKGTMPSAEVATIMERAIHSVMPDAEVVKLLAADGGDGTVQTFLSAGNGVRCEAKVSGPLGDPVVAEYALIDGGKTAVIEMATASGLCLVEGKRRALEATSYGTGELVADALSRGAKKLLIGIGGSACTDGGVGFAQALGISFTDAEGREIGRGGQALEKLAHIDLSKKDKRLEGCEILVACDVDNPLHGPRGAAHVFAKQKGASDSEIEYLDNNLKKLAEVAMRDLGIDIHNVNGAGAAGGLGAGLFGFFGATLKPGIDIVLDAVGFDQAVVDCDLVLTGEGKIDGQSLMGKVPVGIAQRASKYGKPVIAICGNVETDIEVLKSIGITAAFSTLRQAAPWEVAKKSCREDLEEAVRNIMRVYSIQL